MPQGLKFKTWYTFALGDRVTDLSFNQGVSQTVPDQAVSPAELLRRNMAGMSLSGKEPVYNEGIEIPDLRKLDLVEIEEARDKLRQDIEELQEKHRELSKQQADAYDAQRKDNFFKMMKLYEKEIQTSGSQDTNSASTS